LWSKVGCTTPLKADFIQWYSTQTKAKAFADMGYWATATDDDHRTACYGTEKTKWPGATSSTGATNVKVNVRPSQWIMTGSGKNGTTPPGKKIGATSTNQGDGFSKVNVYGDATAKDFDSGNGTFTAPADGLYHIQLNVFSNGTDTNGRNVVFVSTGVSGGEQYAVFNQKSTTSECSYNWTQMVWLSKGDQTYFRNDSGASPNIFYYADKHTNLSIIRIY